MATERVICGVCMSVCLSVEWNAQTGVLIPTFHTPVLVAELVSTWACNLDCEFLETQAKRLALCSPSMHKVGYRYTGVD